EERVSLPAGGQIAPGTQFHVEDDFRAANDYHLLPLGLSYTRRSGPWRLNLGGNIAIGFMRQEVEVRGRTTTSVGEIAQETYDAGLLALASNRGDHQRYLFAWSPELTLNLERRLPQGWSLYAGYSVLYLSDVARAPDHVDTTIDPNLIPPALASDGVRPAFSFRSSGEWLHGMNLGIGRRF
ncbi:MAG: BBP7 family outer membrane beta-barrel protein, partial [Planctomycetota bacterium]